MTSNVNSSISNTTVKDEDSTDGGAGTKFSNEQDARITPAPLVSRAAAPPPVTVSPQGGRLTGIPYPPIHSPNRGSANPPVSSSYGPPRANPSLIPRPSVAIGSGSKPTTSAEDLFARSARYLSEKARLTPALSLDPRATYQLRGSRLGLCVIVNQKHFSKDTGQNTRDGTDRDAESLCLTFASLGFQVERYDDLDCRTLADLVIYYSSKNTQLLTESAMFVFCVLTHGVEGRMFATDGEFEVENLLSFWHADKCPALAGKPKLFFFQACRGSKFDSGQPQVSHDGDASGKQEKEFKIPVESDFFVCYSTVPGFFSWRNSEDGSWFVQALSSTLNTYVLPYLRLNASTSKIQKGQGHLTLHQDVASLTISEMMVDGASPARAESESEVDGARSSKPSQATNSVPQACASTAMTASAVAAGLGTQGPLAQSSSTSRASFSSPSFNPGSLALAPPYHLGELLTLAGRTVAYAYESNTGRQDSDRMKQMPQVCSTLTHLLYLQHEFDVPGTITDHTPTTF